MNPETCLAELNIQLPSAPKPMGLYKPVLIVGNLAYVSGHAPLCVDGSRMTGRVGADFTLEQGQAAARQAGIAILASLRHKLGTLNRIQQVVKVLGMVNCTPEFTQHPAVINGCSEVFVQIFGKDQGVGVRSACGMNSLPGGIAVEIEAVFELEA